MSAKIKRRHFVAVFLLLLDTPWSPVFAKAEFSLSVGFDYTTGDYGQVAETEMIYLPLTARYQTDQYKMWLTIPYLYVDGPGGVTRDLGPIRQTTQTTTTTESGIGDTIAGLSYVVHVDASRGLLVDVTGKIKVATANESEGLGTGENDYSLQVDIYQKWKAYTLIATLGYTRVGNPPDLDLDNRTYHSFGIARKVSDTTQIGLLVDASSEEFNFDYDREELFGYLSQRLSSRQKIQYYAIYGLEEGSPDAGFGIVYTRIFK